MKFIKIYSILLIVIVLPVCGQQKKTVSNATTGVKKATPAKYSPPKQSQVKKSVTTTNNSPSVIAPKTEPAPIIDKPNNVTETKKQENFPASTVIQSSGNPAKPTKAVSNPKPRQVPTKTVTYDDTYYNPFGIGIKGGYSMATLTTTGRASDNKVWLPRYQVGVFAHIPLGEFLAIQTEINYSKRGLMYKYNDDFEQLDMSYLEIPLLLKYQTDGEVLSFFAYGGGYAGYWFQGQLISKSSGTEKKLDYPYDNDLSDGYSDNRLDYGAMAGLGIKIYAGSGAVILDARYAYGLADISNFDPLPQNYVKSSHRVGAVSIGYVFDF
jgi:Outer membrane protein beta-barrel domain